MTLHEEALQIAITQIGQQEHPKGSNWGTPVKNYLASVNIGFPASWCAAVVYWVFNEAARILAVVNPVPKTGGVLKMWSKIPKKNRITVPVPGCIFFVDYGHGLGHAGIVEWIAGDVLHTLEGNTNDEGSREGYEYCRRERHRSWVNLGYAFFG